MFYQRLIRGIAFLLPIIINSILCHALAMDLLKSEPGFITNYKQQLPIIHQSDNLAQAVCEFLLSFKQELPSLNEEGLKARLSNHISQQKPLQLLLVGFPSKSTNTETKVIGPTVDLGEYIALITLNHIVEQISKIYSPGAHMTIISDGVLYTEALRMPEDLPQQYGDQLQLLAQSLSTRIKILTLRDFEGPAAKLFPHDQREYFLKEKHFACSPEDDSTLKGKKYFAESEFKCEVWNMYFITQALEKLKLSHVPVTKKDVQEFNTIKNSYRKKQVETLLQAISEGSQQFGAYISKFYPNYSDVIRLSVHAHGDVSQKLGINVIYNAQGTPWHKTPLVTPEGIRLIYLGELPKNSSLQILEINGVKLPYYEIQ
jgi:pyoverdine/dityrosine biosynthesis protein Dit1